MADNDDVSLKNLFGGSKEAGDGKSQDEIINHIFTSCSGDSAAIEVNKLIEFITPFLEENVKAVEELKRTLDPDDLNEEINFDHFRLLMESWISKISEDEDIHNITPRDFRRFDEGDLSFVQSTPKSNFGHHILKEYAESGIMNASISTYKYSLNDVSATKGIDRTIFEEQIQELEHQKKKMAEEMERVKAELVISMETNENLQVELQKALKKLNSEQKLVEQLQQMSNRDDDYEAELEKCKVKAARLEKNIESLEKKIDDLNEELVEVRFENEKLEKKNEKVLKSNEQLMDEMAALQADIDNWKKELRSQQEQYVALKDENFGLHQVVEEYMCEIEKLRFEKQTLESLLKPATKKITELNQLSNTFTRSNSFNRTTEKREQIVCDDGSKDSDSGDDLPIKLHYMASINNGNESLKEEISKATSGGNSFASDNFTQDKFSEGDDSLSTHSDQMEEFSSSKDYELKFAQLNDEVLDLKTRLSLSEDKRNLLLDRNRSLEEVLADKKNNLAEMTAKLSAYDKMSKKCKDLTAEINRLENDNGLKYIKIVELTKEIDKLKNDRKEPSVENLEEEEELENVIEELKSKKEEIENEKERLEGILERMEQERTTIKLDVQTLLTNNMKLDEKGRDLEHEILILKYERDNLAIKTSTIEIKLQELESENSSLREDVKKLQQNSLSAKSSLSTLERDQRDLNELTLNFKLEKLEKEKNSLFQEKERLSNTICSANKEKDRLRQEISILRKELKNKEQELEDQLSQSQKDFMMSDEEKRDMEQEIDHLQEALKEFSCLKHHHQELKHKHQELVSELNQCNDKLEKNLQEISSLKLFESKCNKLMEEIENVNRNNEKLNEEIKTLNIKIKEDDEIKLKQNNKLQKALIDKASIEREISHLKEHFAELTKINETITNDLEKSKSESSLFKIEKIHLERDNEKLKKEYQEKFNQLTKTLKKYENDYHVLKVTHEICEEENKELSIKCSKELLVCRGELHESHSKNELIVTENIDLKSKVESMEMEITELKNKILQCNNEKCKFEEIKYNLEREKENLLDKLEKNKLNLETRDGENKQLHDKNVDLHKRLEQSQTVLASYKSINEEITKTNADLKILLQQKDQIIHELKTEIKRLKETENALMKEENKLQQTLQELNDIKLKLDQKELSFSHEISTLKESKQNLNEELYLYKEMCESYEHKTEDMKMYIKTLEDRVKANADLLKERDLKLNQLQTEIDLKLHELKEIGRKYDELKEDKGEDKQNIDRLHKDIEKKNITLNAFINENMQLKALLKNPEQVLNKLKQLSDENKHLKEHSNESSERDKVKMIEEINKSFSDAMEKVYKTEKKICESEDDFSVYCQREIEKYKKENQALKECYEKEITNLLEEKGAILNRLKHVESEMEITKNELEGFLIEKESSSTPNLRETKRKPIECRSESKLNSKRINYEKMSLRKEKLEHKVLDLEEQLKTEKSMLAQAIAQKKLIEEKLKSLSEDNLRLQEQLNIFRETDQCSCLNNQEIESLTKDLEKYKVEFQKLYSKLEEDEQVRKATFNHLDEIKESLSQKRCALENNIFSVVKCYHVPDGLVRKIFMNEVPLKISERFSQFENEILKTKEQMEISSNIMNYLCSKKSNFSFQTVSCQTDIATDDNKSRTSTFVLKPPTLVLKPHDDPLEKFKFACSGDAGRSRDLAVVYPRTQEFEVIDENVEQVSLEEDVLPVLNEEKLEKLGLNTNLRIQDISDNDLEIKFTKISSAYDLDLATIAIRLRKQQDKVVAMMQKLLEDLQTSKSLLEEFRNIEGLSRVLGRLDLVGKSCEKLVALAELLGCLRREKAMMGCLGVVIEHMNRLKSVRNNVENQFPSIESSLNKSNKSQLQVATVDQSVVPNLRLRSTSTQSMNLERTTIMKTHISPRPLIRATGIITYCMVGWIIFVVICCCLLGVMLLDEDNAFMPWGINSYDSPWLPFVRKQYLRGLPPT